MTISWKSKFKPEVILNKIDKTRTISPEGVASFSGFEFHQHIPILASMLKFPNVSEHVNQSSLITSGLSKAKGKLTPQSFLVAINDSLDNSLRKRVESYYLATSLSIKPRNEIPKTFRVGNNLLKFHPKGLPRKFECRNDFVSKRNLDIEETPESYLAVTIETRGKSPLSAAQQAIDSIDLFRGICALYVNLAMQWGWGSSQFKPINRVRCGGRHTLHQQNGSIAADIVWYEPNFKALEPHDLKDAKTIFRLARNDLRSISRSSYSKALNNALIRYARALDERDPNIAFLKLWSALESLTSPDIADYSKLTKRCSFIYAETDYHLQVLEHLREYRNLSIHAGVETDDARTNCYLLQEYFRSTVHFLKGNRCSFKSLDQANSFLDLPADVERLQDLLKTLRKASKFVSPQET